MRSFPCLLCRWVLGQNKYAGSKSVLPVSSDMNDCCLPHQLIVTTIRLQGLCGCRCMGTGMKRDPIGFRLPHEGSDSDDD